MKCGKKHKDPLGTPLEYMKACKVFEPLASSAYGLCCFYDVGMKATKGSAPISCLMPKTPVTSSQLKALLHKGRRQGCPLLIMAIAGEVVMLHGLLIKLHMAGALQCLPMKCKDDLADQSRTKTSFCPFCSYHCCNDSTFLNHIMSFHYDVGYGCVWRRCSSPPSPSKSTSKNVMTCPMIPLTWAEACIAALMGWQRTNPHTRDRSNHPERCRLRAMNTSQLACPNTRR